MWCRVRWHRTNSRSSSCDYLLPGCSLQFRFALLFRPWPSESVFFSRCPPWKPNACSFPFGKFFQPKIIFLPSSFLVHFLCFSFFFPQIMVIMLCHMAGIHSPAQLSLNWERNWTEIGRNSVGTPAAWAEGLALQSASCGRIRKGRWSQALPQDRVLWSPPSSWTRGWDTEKLSPGPDASWGRR